VTLSEIAKYALNGWACWATRKIENMRSAPIAVRRWRCRPLPIRSNHECDVWRASL
jgi:hypothetical protein